MWLTYYIKIIIFCNVRPWYGKFWNGMMGFLAYFGNCNKYSLIFSNIFQDLSYIYLRLKLTDFMYVCLYLFLIVYLFYAKKYDAFGQTLIQVVSKKCTSEEIFYVLTQNWANLQLWAPYLFLPGHFI
jgi:hypothetical protein